MPRRQFETVVAQFRLTCKGLAAEELRGIYRDLTQIENCCPAFRNPAPLDHAARTIHEIVVSISWPAAGLYIGKRVFDKTVDILARIVEQRLMQDEPPPHKKTVMIHGPDGKPHTEVEVKPEKVRRR